MITVDTLRQDGIWILGHVPEVGDLENHLAKFPTYPGHVRRSIESKDTRCYDPSAVIQTPGLLKYALRLTKLAKNYLEAEPLLFSFNAFWTTKAEDTHPGLQEFHRDKDDTRFLALMIYGTNVLTEDDGPHDYQKGTHNAEGEGELKTVLGPRMTGFLMDGRGLHRGRMPTHDRLIAWVRWGVTDPPPIYVKDGLKPTPKELVPDYPNDPYLQNLIRLVAA